MKTYHNYSLLPHNTFGIDAKAGNFVEYESVEELCEVIAGISPEEEILHIGGGSNLLFTDDFKGTVLHSAIRSIEIVDEDDQSVLLRVGSGAVWDDIVAYSVNQGWGGAENLSLIPGEVGASAVQNIGAYGVEAKDLIALVEAVEMRNGARRVFGNIECDYAYRHSIFKGELKGKYAITHVTYRFSKHPQLKLDYGNVRTSLEALGKTDITPKDVREAIIHIREMKLPDPKVLGNAGSFFMNPVVSRSQFEQIHSEYPDMPFYEVADGIKIPAGWLIENCGWKGKALGKAGVYEKQALVIVNHGGATSQDIVALSDAICKSVKEKFGVEIHPEVNFI